MLTTFGLETAGRRPVYRRHCDCPYSSHLDSPKRSVPRPKRSTSSGGRSELMKVVVTLALGRERNRLRTVCHNLHLQSPRLAPACPETHVFWCPASYRSRSRFRLGAGRDGIRCGGHAQNSFPAANVRSPPFHASSSRSHDEVESSKCGASEFTSYSPRWSVTRRPLTVKRSRSSAREHCRGRLPGNQTSVERPAGESGARRRRASIASRTREPSSITAVSRSITGTERTRCHSSYGVTQRAPGPDRPVRRPCIDADPAQ